MVVLEIKPGLVTTKANVLITTTSPASDFYFHEFMSIEITSNLCSILENILCVLEKNMYLAFCGWESFLYLSINYTSSNDVLGLFLF